jgi:phage-related protein
MLIMSDNFGLRIGIEGEKQFKDALRDINQAFKVLGSEMQLVTSQFDKNDKSVQALTSRNTVLNREIEAQREKITTLRSALDNASTSFGENDKRTQSWQIQLNKAEAELAGMEKELKANNVALMSNSERYDYLSKEIAATVREYIKVRDEYGKNSAEAKALEARLGDLTREQRDAGKAADEEDKQITEVTKSLGLYERSTKSAASETEKSGISFTKVADTLKDVGKAIAGVVTAVGAAATSVGVGMFKMAEGAANTGREVNIMSQKLGLSRQGFQEWEFILKKSGTSIDVMNIGMKTLQKTMGGLTEDGDSASKAFAAVGISFDEIKGKTPEEALNMTIRALQDLPPGADRTAAALKLFGRGAMELQPLLNKTSAETDELRQRAHDLGLVLGDAQIDNSLKFRSAMGRIKDTMQGMKLQIASSLVPAFADGLEAFLDFASGVEGGEAKMKSAVDNITATISTALPEFIQKGAQMISALVTGISSALPGIAEAIADVLPQLIDVITSMVPQLVNTIMTAIPSIIKAILSALPAIADAAVQIAIALARGLSDMIPNLIPIAVEAIMSIVQTLIANVPQLLEASLQIITGLADGLLLALPKLIAALPTIIKAIVNFIIGAIPQLIDAGIRLLTSLITALPTIIQAVVAAIPKIINSVISAIIDSIPLIIDSGVKLLIALIENLPTIITTIVAAIPQIISGLVNAIIGNIDKIILAGVQLLIALITNLPTIIVEIVKAIPQIITGIVSAIASFVPQIVEAGANLIKGLWQGILKVKDWIWSKIKGFMGGIVSSIKSFFGIHSPSTLFAGIGRDMGEGIGVGFEDAMDQVARDMRNAIPRDFDLAVNASGGYSDEGYLTGANITQNISITSPKALSEKEAAREFKNLSRKLALEI